MNMDVTAVLRRIPNGDNCLVDADTAAIFLLPEVTPARSTRTRVNSRRQLELTQQPLRFRNSHADRLAEAQLRKSGRSNLAPGCWESCLSSWD
ncbi:hypothetical protein T4E_7054 [Trichinella pseudospiralis]|uniref:Uncharacterized protein n=1 Tax=Trichinella pseudospiralis TaxID=6337 RepID=A0A0V1FB91_TRIPS|nr:hypothetical protein T4E_7054 [Trichinella pseudospiralis]KRY83025.1 hypothetical protein T4D_2044 [Trichinella pseudospiralis]